MGERQTFDTLVFSGGGTRCFWHGGFMEGAGKALPLDVARVSAVSGGVLSAAAWIAKGERDLLDIMAETFEENGKGAGNFDWSGVFDGKRPFPHEALYRDIVERLMTPERVEAVADGPAFRVRMARPGPLGAFVAMAAYGTDLAVRSSPHPRIPSSLGAKPVDVDGRKAARDGRLVDLIVAAASIPPLFSRKRWDGEPVIDGGVVDNAPPFAEGKGRTLLLVTRCYKRLPERPDRVYACPSSSPPTFKLDFTDAQGIREVWALGKRDASGFLTEHGLG